MKTTRFFYMLPLLILSLGCVDKPDDPTPPPPRPGEPTRRIVAIAYSAGETLFPLKGVSAEIVDIESVSDWLRVSDAGVVDGTTCVNISLSEFVTRPEGMKDSVLVHAGDELVNLVVNQARIDEPGISLPGNQGVDFITQWENVDTVRLVERNGDPILVNLPWAGRFSSTIPLNIRSDVKAEDGWTMAFCLFDNNDLQKYNYFGLYNTFTGILRVFYYQPSISSVGGELSFTVTPNNHTTPKFPFYHMMQYGIPASMDRMHERNNLLVPSSSETFQFTTTPYYIMDNKMAILSVGWTAFDIDLSAYNPHTPLYDAGNHDGLTFTGRTQNNSTMTLFGEMIAKMEGTFTDPASSTTVSHLGKGSSPRDNINFFGDLAGSLATGSYFSAVTSLISEGFNIVGSYMEDDEANAQGRISMDLTGQITLGGYVTADTPNDVVNAGFDYDKTLYGNLPMKGIWGLAATPVIYVVKDVVFGEKDIPMLDVTEAQPPYITRRKYGYSRYEDGPRSLHLMQFLDPTTIRINLDTERFNNIENVNVEWCYGVYPFMNPGHTNPYRAMMGLPLVGNLDASKEEWWTGVAPPVDTEEWPHSFRYWMTVGDFPALLRNPKTEADATYGSWTGKQFPYTEFDPAVAPGTPTIDIHSLYHGVLNGSEKNHDAFIVDPVVSLPSTVVNEAVIYDFIVPDFVVWVMLSFEHTDKNGNKRTALYSKRFLPDIKTISLREFMEDYRGRTETYGRSLPGDVRQHVGDNIPVRHAGGPDQMYRTMRLTDEIEKRGY